MRLIPLLVGGLLVSVTPALAQVAPAQLPARLMIQRITLEPDGRVLTIAGTGLGRDVIVTVDGRPLMTLTATETQVEVVAPAVMQTTPGAYCLMVVDPTRQGGQGVMLV